MTPEKLFLILLDRSLAACWMVLAIMILRPFLRRVSRSLCCALWGLVACRLLCPFSLHSVFSLIPNTKLATAAPVSTQTSALDEMLLAVDKIVDAPAADPSAVGSATVSFAQRLTQNMTWIWLSGFALFMLYALLSTLRLYHRVRDSVKQEDGYWLCDWISFPFVFGFFRPRIIMPFNVDERDIPYILAHERAHLKRHDHWRKPIAFLLLAVFWFQPVLWIAYYLLRRDVEFACDERAIRMLGADKECKASYAKALLQSSSPRFYAVKLSSPLAFGGLQVKRRVSSVLKYRKPTATRMMAALLVCAVVAVCFLTDPKVEAGAGAHTETSASEGDETDASYDTSNDEELKQPEQSRSETDDSNQRTIKTTWYISEVFQSFVEEQGCDAQYILDWAIQRCTREEITIFGSTTLRVEWELIMDIDVDLYLEKGIMVKK